MTRSFLPLAAIMLAKTCAPALALDTALFGTSATCLSGNCDNGQGTIRLGNGEEYSGSWANGRFVAGGVYQVRNPVAPDRLVAIQYGADGMPEKGTVLRGSKADMRGLVGEFTGSFVGVHNPFINSRLNSYKQGAYTDHIGGYVYEGEFSYIPIRYPGGIAGYFVFQGARIDTRLDEVVRGLFISDQVLPGGPITFRKARPEYLARIHEEYEAQKQLSQADADRLAREQAARQAQAQAQAAGAAVPRRSGGLFGKLLSVASGLSAIGGGFNQGPVKSNALMGLSGSLTGQTSPDAAMNGILSLLSKHMIKDPKLAQIVGSANSPEKMVATLAGIATKATPISRAQYAEEQASEAQANGGRASGMAQTLQAVNTIVKGQGSSESLLSAMGGILQNRLKPARPAPSAAAPATNMGARPNEVASAPPAAAASPSAPAPVKVPAPAAAGAPAQSQAQSPARPSTPVVASGKMGCPAVQANAGLRKAMVTAAAEKAKLSMFVSPQFNEQAINATFLGCKSVPRESGKGSQPMQVPGHPMTSHGFIYGAYRGYLDDGGRVLSAHTVRADLASGEMALINYYPGEDGADVKGVIGGTDRGYWVYLYQ